MSASPDISIIYQIGLLIVAATVVSGLLKGIRLPGVIGAILVGLFIGGPGGLGLVTDLTAVNLLAALGSILILFTTGLEFDAASFWRVGKTAFLLTTLGVILSVLLGYGIGLMLGFSQQASFLLGAVLAPSGTSVVAAMLSYEGLVETRLGSALLTATVIDDIEGVLILTVALGVISGGTFSATSILRTGLVATLFILVSIYIGSKVLPVVIKRFKRFMSDEILFITLFGLGLMLAFAATQFGLAAVTGAFIMGAIIPYEMGGKRLAEKISLMREIFAVIFFTSIGLVISPVEMLAVLPAGLVVLGVAISARLIGGLAGGHLAGLRPNTIWASAVALVVRAEISFVVAYEGMAMGIVGSDFLALTAIIVIGSIMVVLPLFSQVIKPRQGFAKGGSR